jgi:anti-sigma factor RsiW
VTHDEMKDLVMALYDEELSPSDETAARAHVDGCAECRLELDSWRRAAARIFQKPPMPPSEMFVRRVVERAGPAAPGRAWWRNVFRPAPRWAWTGALAAAAAALWLVFLKSPRPSASWDRAEFADEMSDVSLESVGSDSEGFGTAIETYLM